MVVVVIVMVMAMVMVMVMVTATILNLTKVERPHTGDGGADDGDNLYFPKLERPQPGDGGGGKQGANSRHKGGQVEVDRSGRLS